MTIVDIVAEFCADGEDTYFLVGNRDHGLALTKGLFDTGKFLVITIQGGRLGTKATLFAEFAAVMSFPSYFGRNWDAFDECIRDAIEEERTRTVVILIVDIEGVLRDKREDFRVFLHALRDCGATVVFQCSPAAAEVVFERIIDAGLEGIRRVTMHE